MSGRMEEKYKRYNITNINSFDDLIMDMARAEDRPIHILDKEQKINESFEYSELKENNDFWDDRHKAVWNLRAGRKADIVTSNYKILGHADFFATISDLFRQAGCENITGYVIETDQGDSYHARLLFNDIEIEEPNMGRNLKVGCEFSNSYNSMYAARGRAYYMRMSCANQMLLSNVIKECEFSRSHNAVSQEALLDAVTTKAEDFIGQLIVSGAKFTKIMNKAMTEEVEFIHPAQLAQALEDLFKTKKHSENIYNMALRKARIIQNKYYLNMWDTYNCVTDYCSHQAMTPQTFEQILYKAEKNILQKPISMPADKQTRVIG